LPTPSVSELARRQHTDASPPGADWESDAAEAGPPLRRCQPPLPSTTVDGRRSRMIPTGARDATDSDMPSGPRSRSCILPKRGWGRARSSAPAQGHIRRPAAVSGKCTNHSPIWTIRYRAMRSPAFGLDREALLPRDYATVSIGVPPRVRPPDSLAGTARRFRRRSSGRDPVPASP